MKPAFAGYGAYPVRLDYFNSGVPDLDDFLRCETQRYTTQGLSAVKLLIDTETDRIIGFYAISPVTVQIKWLSLAQQSHFKVKFPIPAWLIGRLAVDKTYQNMHLGEALLFDAIANIQQRADGGAGALIVVDAKNDVVKRFYEKYGFRALSTSKGLKLARPLTDIAE